VDLDFVIDPEVTADLRAQFIALWTDVTNNGGAVGFVPPVTAADLAPAADRQIIALADRRARLVGAFQDGRLVGTAFLTFNTHPLMQHWCMVTTVMVDPALQGSGTGAQLMREVELQARELGFTGLRLGARGGLGLERFYASVGYKEVGRIPGAIRVAPGDDRDDITLYLPLT
jgi:GNAT superfamily N-acetyltransferase